MIACLTPIEPNVIPEWSTAAFRNLFPTGVSVVTTDGRDDPPAPMPEEAQAVADAVASRRREFALGRWCARRALEEFDMGNRAIPVGAQRAPSWPEGIVGSITHCAGFVGAVVGSTSKLSAIGFDAERAEPLSPDLIPMICTAPEVEWVQKQRGEGVDWPKVIFSAKESIHKCIWPRCRQTLDFLDVSIRIDSARMQFVVEEVRPPCLASIDFRGVSGRIAIVPSFVFTCAFSNLNATF
jgi:enterobactin synthetase component D / holo-[acyl-carrier protein] synthase